MMVSFNVVVAKVLGFGPILIAQHITSSAAVSTPIVDLGYALHQATFNNDTGIAYYNFSNIRYAAPPVGHRRFAVPVQPATNRTVNNGQHGAICPQASPYWTQTAFEFALGVPAANLTLPPSGINLSSMPIPDPRETEDCLFLDVIAPTSLFPPSQPNNKHDEGCKGENGANLKSLGAPVLVWIHGGGYIEGSKEQDSNPAGLLERGKDNDESGFIYVAINYRLGVYGWLSGPTFQTSGTANAGLYDQRFALEWVQENIHLFGGDPNRVTIMGESAGGGSVMHQITAYGGLKGKVPFQQAIPQSGAWILTPSNAQQESNYLQTLNTASIVTGRNITTFDQLRALDATELYSTNYAMMQLTPYGLFPYGPTVDGIFAPKSPGELLLHRQYDQSLNIMVGHISNEGILFTSPWIQSETALVAFIHLIIPTATNATIDYITQVLYPPVFDGSHGYTSYTQRTALLISEYFFTCNGRYVGLASPDPEHKVYSYQFTIPPGIHGVDVAYTFFNGDTTTPDFGVPLNETIAVAWQLYISRFVIKGDPNGVGTPHFPGYGKDAMTLKIDAIGLRPAVDVAANERCAWWGKALYY